MFILFECRAGTAMAAKVYQVNHCVTADFRLALLPHLESKFLPSILAKLENQECCGVVF